MIVSLFGPPGAGKSSAGDWLSAKHGFLHLPLGRILKDEAPLKTIGVSREEHGVPLRRAEPSNPSHCSTGSTGSFA